MLYFLVRGRGEIAHAEVLPVSKVSLKNPWVPILGNTLSQDWEDLTPHQHLQCESAAGYSYGISHRTMKNYIIELLEGYIIAISEKRFIAVFNECS